MIMQGQVGAPPTTSGTDGANYGLLQGKTTELIVSELHGKYLTQNWRNNLFTASLTSASALVAPATNATPNFAIWNPAGNNVAVALVRMSFGYVSGTPAAAAIGYSYVPYAGSTIAGTSAISAFTSVTVRPGVIGRSYGGNVLAGSAATVTGSGIAAAVFHRWSPFSQGAIASASVAAGMVMSEDFDGTVIIPPNMMFYPVSSAASVATYMISALWEEIPWP